MVKIDLPLSIVVGKKKFILNLNNYRNVHYRSLNNYKVKYAESIAGLLPSVAFKEPVELVYTYYHGNRRKVDVSNPCSVIDKFTCDALTSKGIIIDDNIDYIKSVKYVWGGVDKDNPRCELKITKGEHND